MKRMNLFSKRFSFYVPPLIVFIGQYTIFYAPCKQYFKTFTILYAFSVHNGDFAPVDARQARADQFQYAEFVNQ